MSPNRKAGILAVCLLLTLGLVLALQGISRSRLAVTLADVTRVVPHVNVTEQTESRIPPKAVPTRHATPPVRRDADFWPQTAHPVKLLRRTVLPSLTVDSLPDISRHVWLVQFGGPLSDQAKADLRNVYRVEALCPSADMCFYVRASIVDLINAAENLTPELLGWVRLNPDDKILSNDMAMAQARVALFPGADKDSVSRRVNLLGGRVVRTGSDWLDIERTGPGGMVVALAELDDVYMIEPARPKLTVHNAEAEANSNATPLFTSPYNLTGAGIAVMVRDEGRIFAHPDFSSRLAFGPDVANLQPVQHATHVAGTIGGDGSSIPLAGARGFAPGCSLISYDLNGDESAEPLQAFQMFGAIISNHSYGFLTGWDDVSGTFTDNQSTFGLYGSFARNWDILARNQGLIIIKSAGNLRDGNGAGHQHNGTLATDGEYYNTVDQSGTSKNVLLVGAARDAAIAGAANASKLVLPFSSSGPTADGRLRPEIVADGETLLSCDNTPVTGNTYVSLSGTSMAAAAVSGTAALFMQRYKQLVGSTASCPPHYLRAVFAQTATDLGTPGPDYLHGFGMLDALGAVNLLNADAGAGTRIVSSSVSASNPERFFMLSSNGSTPIKGTLCWSDDPGDALAKKTLINDLDLRLIKVDDQTTSFPFTLDPSAPEQPAKAGINTVDTIEQLIFSAPPAGNYLFAVKGATLITATSFALASSHGLTEVLPPTPSIVPSVTSGPPPLLVNFDGSSSSAAAGQTIAQFLWSFGDGTSAQGATVQHTFGQGLFLVVLKVIDSKGASASTSVKISVANTPPVAALAASPSSGVAPLNVLLDTDGSFDPDGTISSYAIDFGDGTSGSGPNATHTYTTPGLYTPTLTVTDNGGASAARSTNVYVGESFTPTSARFGLNFALHPRDTFTIATRTLPIAPNLDTTGLQGTIIIGQASYKFILDSKGNYSSPVLKVKLLPMRAIMTVRIAQANLAAALASSSASNTTVKAQRVLIPFAVNLAGNLSFGSVGLPFSYTAQQGLRATGTFLKK